LTGELIERYLDELQLRLSGAPREIRRTLREVEEHLHDAMEAGLARGLDAGEAEQQAVAAFGPAAGVARACNVSTWQLLRSLAAQALALVGVALVAVGLSGAVIAVMVAAGGRVFAFADPAGTRYSAADCAHWLGQHPGASSCAQAALDEAVSDGLLQRSGAGVVGLIVLAAVAFLAHRNGTSLRALLTRPVAAIVGATAFGAAGVVLTNLGGNAVLLHAGNGAGQWFAAAGVSVVAALAFAAIALRRMRDMPI
jgi:hypothetical protein